ncbi:MAG: hypothetical protein COB20_12810 [SAR86 cluster bacterium]|uniref:ABC transporter permease n=1 Tax=SAR86 cluster bacterium TaxID=2030880 RepID=A0A2A4WYC7_9GAMM|nr:MAG: hypothetical protein COB20_12810 [SAR86 cluster bacterium]
MFKNYLTTTFNNLLKNRAYTIINVTGLSVGLAACIMIALYVQDERSFDKHWNDSAQIFRLNRTVEVRAGSLQKGTSTSILALPLLKRTFSEEIESGTRLLGGRSTFSAGTESYTENLIRIDKDFPEIFQLEVIAGSLEVTLQDPRNIALSEEVAIKFFGKSDVIGEVITRERREIKADHVVTAVYRKPLEKTILDFPLLSLIDDLALAGTGLDVWFNGGNRTIIKLKEGADVDLLGQQLPSFIDQNIDIAQLQAGQDVMPSDRVSYELQKLPDAYLGSAFVTYGVTGNAVVVLAFSVIAVLVLLIASINFMILTTVKATQRAQEVAMRKVLGARRHQLVLQFIGESFFIVLLSMLLALVGVELLLPVFETLVGKSFAVPYTEAKTYLSLLGLLIVVGCTGGIYPAIMLSRFRPVRTLRGARSTENKTSIAFRNLLVVFQFTVSITLIAATAVIFVQINYANLRDPGYNSENLIVLENPVTPGAGLRLDTLQQQLHNLSSISDIGFSNFAPMRMMSNSFAFTRKDMEGGSSGINLPSIHVDQGFLQTYQIPLIAGRYYDEDRDQELVYDGLTLQTFGREFVDVNVVLNASAVQLLGYSTAEAAIGGKLGSNVQLSAARGDIVNLTIVGVVADTQFMSLRREPTPTAYILAPDYPFQGTLALRFLGNPQEAVSQVEKIWDSVVGGERPQMFFLRQEMREQFRKEQSEAVILVSFSLLAIVIACLGLFGLASFTVQRRTKEIGLRKVMGAKIRHIVSLLVVQFSIPVLIANVFAWPITVWIMLNWLQQFPYQIEAWLLLPLCFAAGFAAMIIAWVTVAGNTFRVARSSPILSLRYE